MTFTKPTVLYLSVLILLFYAGAVYTFASPPGSPYTVADNITDPACAPNSTNCYVSVVTADSGLTATGSNIQLGGTLLQDTLINQGTFNFTVAQAVPAAGNIVTSQGLTQVTGAPGTVTGYLSPNGDAARHITWVTGASNEIIQTLSGSGDPNLLNGGTEISTSYDVTDTSSGLITLYAFDTPGSRVTRLQVAPTYINLLLSTTSELRIAGSAGSSGQVITSSGTGARPTWQTPAISVNNVRTLYSASVGAGQGNISSGDNIALGYQAALGASNTTGAIFLGRQAGSGSDHVNASNFIGYQAGYQATDAGGSNFIGALAGAAASQASSSNFIGGNAGQNATDASNSNFIGRNAGKDATTSTDANFFGSGAGQTATNAYHSNFLGPQAGSGAAQANNSNFMGYSTGENATNASQSNFFGPNAGNGATNASYSTFMGVQAGTTAVNAKNAVFIGNNAGYLDTVDNTTNTDDFSILIGNNTSTGGFENSIALGSYAVNTVSNQFMIGSATRPIDTLVLTGSSGNTCVLDVTVASPSCSSDETLKTNITDLSTSTLEKLLRVKTVSYNWKNYPDKGSQIGFLAQDLEQYFPEVVSVAPNGFKTVSYGGMTPILVEAVRELNMKVTALALGQTPTTVFDGIKIWLGDASNGIENLFAKKITTEQLCVRNAQGETCLSRDALDRLLQQQTTPTLPVTPPVDSLPEPVVETPPTDQPTDTQTPTPSE
jgi:hypothetical protein